MRLKIALVGMGAIFLLAAGFRPDGLPFVRGDTRYSDAALAHWPNALFLRQSVLERGEFPLWRETTMGGQPFAANPLNKTTYPLQWLALLLPPALHLNVLIALHLFLAGAGMWRWARALGLREEAAALSALAYTLAPKTIAHLGAGHLDILYALTWWPWLMESILQSTQQPNRPLRHALRTAVFAALLFLGDLRLGLFALLTAAFYEIWLLENGRQAAWRLLLVPIFFLLTAAVLIPLLGWQPYLNRADLTPAEAGVFALEPGNLVGLLLPAHSGNFETVTYLGLPVLALACIGLRAQTRRMAVFWLLLIGFAGLYALGNNGLLWPLLVRLAPGLLWFRVPSRAWFVVVLVGALLAGYGLDALLRWLETTTDEHRLSRYRLVAVGGIAGSLACGGFTLLALKPLPPTVGIAVLLIGGLLGVVCLLMLNRRVTPRLLSLLFMGLTFADLAFTGYQWLSWRGPEYWLEPYRPLAERLAAAQPDRIYSPTYSLEQQVAEAYGLHLFGGVDPFQLRGVVRGIEAGGGVHAGGYSVVQPPLTGAEGDADTSSANRDAVIDAKALAAWHVSHVVAAYPIDNPRLGLLDTVNGVYIYANKDYAPAPETTSITGWPPDAPDLPPPTTVARLNQWTLLSTVISGLSWLIAIAALLLTYVRQPEKIWHPKTSTRNP
jgi:hypothetical protein